MPQDRPSINASDRDAVGMSTNAATAKMPSAPMPDADGGGQDRQTGGDDRAESDQQDDERDGDADDLGQVGDG